MRARLYLFEGQLLTPQAIREKYPAYSEKTIRDALAAGAESLADLHRADAEAVARRRRMKPKASSHFQIVPKTHARPKCVQRAPWHREGLA